MVGATCFAMTLQRDFPLAKGAKDAEGWRDPQKNQRVAPFGISGIESFFSLEALGRVTWQVNSLWSVS